MARFSVLFAMAAMAMAATSGVLGEEANKAVIDADDLDELGNPIQYINSIYGDEDDDDYTEEELEARDVMRRSKHHHKHSRKNKGKQHYVSPPNDNDELWQDKMKITWYASNDLKNPQCGNGGGSWQPENHSHIGAVVKGWKNGPDCGEFVKLCRSDKCLRVRVIDKCAGCTDKWIDLTKSAFKKLSKSGTLDEGVVNGLKMYRTVKPNPWDIALFGPKVLKVQY